MNTHYFGSTGEAYNACQTREDIKNGDVLVVESEKVVGFLLDAWCVAVTVEVGAFHTKAEDAKWEELKTYGPTPISFVPSAKAAVAEAKRLGYPLRPDSDA